jgi:crotonobetainyl-CoA:carnitine CoA-transferase CaiB-like acyl-CoA transferase
MAPHGVFPCRGDDRWVALAVESDEQWHALAGAVGRPGLAGRFPTLAARQRHEDEIDGILGAWTADRDRDEVAATLQAAGVAAAPVEDGRDLVDGDGHLRARGFYVELDHPVAGPALHEGIAVRLTDTPGAVRRPAPRLGEHTDEVLSTLAGMSEIEIVRLREAGVLE